MKDDNDMAPGKTQSTGRATKAAANLPKHGPSPEELPTLGELDGVFYFLKHLSGEGEIPEQTHRDAYEELNRMAINNGYRPDEATARMYQAARAEEGWDVHYAVDVVPNTVQG